MVLNQDNFSQLTTDQQRYTIDHEIFHWRYKHPLQIKAMSIYCQVDSADELTKYDEFLAWRRCQEQQADIAACVVEAGSARAAQDKFHDALCAEFKKVDSKYNVETGLTQKHDLNDLQT